MIHRIPNEGCDGVFFQNGPLIRTRPAHTYYESFTSRLEEDEGVKRVLTLCGADRLEMDVHRLRTDRS